MQELCYGRLVAAYFVFLWRDFVHNMHVQRVSAQRRDRACGEGVPVQPELVSTLGVQRDRGLNDPVSEGGTTWNSIDTSEPPIRRPPSWS
jgi:hypothetical protein